MMTSKRGLTRALRPLAPVMAILMLLTACSVSGSDTSGSSNDAELTTSTQTVDSSSDETSESITAVSVDSVVSVDPADLEWDQSEAVVISLEGSSAVADSSSVMIDGSTITIQTGGTYVLSGELTDGRVVVDSADDQTVRLVLDGVVVSNESGPAIAVSDAESVIVVLADGSSNHLEDGTTYASTYLDSNLDATLVSKSDLVIGGDGELTVVGHYNDGIASSDGLLIASGVLVIDAVDDGVRGKDYLAVESADLTVNAGGDGLKSDNEDGADVGYIAIAGGSFTIEAGGDAIAAETDLQIASGTFALTTTGAGGVDSAKGLKAGVSLVVDGGSFDIDTADDSIHSNGSISINGGEFALSSGDDGIHADASLTIHDGVIAIAKSYEGLESAVVTLNGGEIEIVADDDGINISGGNDGSGQAGGFGGGGRGGGDNFANEDYWLHINGGTTVIYADGDGIDVNGYFDMSGGTVIVHGPTMNMNGALDVNGTFEISGGFLVAAGSAGMAETPDASSEQAFVAFQLNGSRAAGSITQIVSDDGSVLVTFETAKAYQAFVFSSPDLVSGESYEIYVDGQASGSSLGGVYQSEAVSGTSIGTVSAS